MTTPAAQRLGCRVLDKYGWDWTERAYEETGYAEWKALELATEWARYHSEHAPFRVITTETLHTIEAPNAAD